MRKSARIVAGVVIAPLGLLFVGLGVRGRPS
jgi:hypothetical protein